MLRLPPPPHVLLQQILEGSGRAPIYSSLEAVKEWNPQQRRGGIKGLTMRITQIQDPYVSTLDPDENVELRMVNNSKDPLVLQVGVYQRFCRASTDVSSRYCRWDRRPIPAMTPFIVTLAPGEEREFDLLMPTPPAPATPTPNPGEVLRMEVIVQVRDQRGRVSSIVRTVGSRTAPPII